MAENLLPLLEADPDRVAITDEFGTFTRAEVNGRVNRLVHALREGGVGAGDVVALLSGNRHEAFETIMALGSAAMVMVPVNWHFTGEEIAYILNDSGAKALVADVEFAGLAAEAAEDAPGLALRVMFGADDPAGVAKGFACYEDLLAAASDAEPADQAAGSYMLYTSGTTGRPKGVRSTAFAPGQPLAVRNVILEGLAGMLQIPREGVALVNSPIYHGGPFLFSLLPAVLGATLVVRRKFDPVESLRLIDEHKVTTAYFVPTHFVRFLRLDESERSGFDGGSLQAVYHTAAPCPPDVKQQMIDWWGPVIHELYAATETGALGTFITGPDWVAKPGSVGRAMPVIEILVLDDDGKRLGPNEVGQVYVKNLLGGDFEYHNAPEKTADAHLEAGVMTVGDVGYLDDDGFLFLCDRKIDMIISGGVNIYPAEIESVLVNHPAVADAAVFGVPNDEFGEEVKAVVELVPGRATDEAELVAHCREHLAGFKVPRSVEFRSLPRTPTGKLLKRELRDPYWAGQSRSI
jgi:long-chain acyl-CoA synthetase